MLWATGRDWRVESIDEWGPPDAAAELETADEPMGTKEKFWVRSPDGREVLFKFARVRHGRTMGEDWVEWVVHQLASLLAIPTAVAIPALYESRRGVLSFSVLAPGERLIHGNELLASSDSDYDSATSRRNPGYTVDAVFEALRGVSAPQGSAPVIRTAFDAWAGYLFSTLGSQVGTVTTRTGQRSNRQGSCDSRLPSTTATPSGSRSRSPKSSLWHGIPNV